MLQAKPLIIAPTLPHFVWVAAPRGGRKDKPPRSFASRNSLPPEGAARLWPGEAGSTAPLEWIGCALSPVALFPQSSAGS